MDSPPPPPPSPDQPGPEASTPVPLPECPVCYLPYDTVFHSPRLLPCAHTFCLECLARLCAFLKAGQSFRCPLCRGAVPVPRGGVPKLPPSQAVVQLFPPGMWEPQEVWLDGFRLCWLKRPRGCSEEEAAATVVTVDLHGASSGAAERRSPVGVWRPTHLATCRALWRHHPSVFCAAGLLLFAVLFSMALILALQRPRPH